MAKLSENQKHESPDVTPVVGSGMSYAEETPSSRLTKLSWRNPLLLVFVAIIAAIGVYLIVSSSAESLAATKTWSTASDWNTGTLSNTSISGNSVSLTPKTTSSSSTSTSTPSSTNLALNRPVYASSVQSSQYPAKYADDGNLNTRWSSTFSNSQWIYVDLGKTYNISEVKLNWEMAYAKAYKIQTSTDAKHWTTIYTTSTGKGGISTLTGLKGTGRYVRMDGTKRGTQWGYSLWEMAVYAPSAPTTTTTTTSTTTYPSSGTITLPFDAGTSVAWTSLSGQTTTPANTSVSYQVRTSSDNSTWSSWVTVSSTGSLSSLGSSRYIQLEATLNTTNSSDTPTLTQLTLGYNVPVASVTAGPSNSTQPSVTGNMQVGQSLSSTTGTWADSPSSYSYQWEDCSVEGESCSIISGATSPSYTIQSSDVGHSLRSVVTATNTLGSVSMYSGATGLATPACTTTFTTTSATNLSSAAAGSTGGQVFCFASGNYGNSKSGSYVDTGQYLITNVSASSNVYFEPAPGATVSGVGFLVSGATNVVIENFGGQNTASSLGGFTASGGNGSYGNNTNVYFLNNSMTSDGGQVNDSGTVASQSVYIERNNFTGFASSGEQDRMLVNTGYNDTISCPNNVYIEHNLFSGGESDGIDIDGGTCGTKITGNVISNIQQTNCGGIHCDAFQDNGGGENTTFEDNWIYNTTDCFGLYDNTTNYTVENNVCSDPSPDTSFWMQFGGADNFTFEHNTITSTAGSPYYNYNGVNNTGTFTNNAWASSITPDPNNAPGSPFTQDYNLSSSTAGTHDVKGTPTFVGGNNPSQWTGFQLAPSSAGKGAGNDGQDMGVEANFFNIGTTQPSGTLPGLGG
jgi:hypothetical protein